MLEVNDGRGMGLPVLLVPSDHARVLSMPREILLCL